VYREEAILSERRFEDGPEEPGDPLEKQEEGQAKEKPKEKPVDGEPWAKTSSGEAE
jgi:hypothetical protein